MTLAEVEVGDYVRSAAGDDTSRGAREGDGLVWARVIFTHTHADPATTVGVSHRGGTLWLTRTHPLRLASGELRRAGDVVVGDELLALGAMGDVSTTTVTRVLPARTQDVKYILTDTDMVVVDEIVAPTQSTMAGWFELLPFKVVVSLLLVM